MSLHETLQQAVKEAYDLTEQVKLLELGISVLRDERLHKIEAVITAARAFQSLNIPYKFGGEYENDKAFDCSAFTQKSFSTIGELIPRASYQQITFGVAIDEEERGCLIFWDRNGDGKSDHVGISLGNDMMIHTAKLGENINVANWKLRYGTPLAIRRIL